MRVVATLVCVLALAPAAHADDTPNVAPDSIARASLFGGIVERTANHGSELGSEIHLFVDVAPTDWLHLHAAAPLTVVEGVGWEPGTLAVGTIFRVPPFAEELRRNGTIWLGADLLLALGDRPAEHDLPLSRSGVIGTLDRRQLGRFWALYRHQRPGVGNHMQLSVAVTPTTEAVALRANMKFFYPLAYGTSFLMGFDYESFIHGGAEDDLTVGFSLGLGWHQLTARVIMGLETFGLVIAFEQSLGRRP